MRISTLILILTIITLNNSCDLGCKQDCFTPPEEIRIKIIDVNSNNLIETGYYIPDSIQLYYYDNQTKRNVQFDLSTYYPYFKNIIFSSELAWVSVGERRDYFLRLNYLDTDTLALELKEKNDGCCTFFDIDYFKINGKTAEYSNTEFVYLIRKE